MIINVNCIYGYQYNTIVIPKILIHVWCECAKKIYDNNFKLITLSHNDKYEFIINTLRLEKNLLPTQAYHCKTLTKFQFNDKRKENKKKY